MPLSTPHRALRQIALLATLVVRELMGTEFVSSWGRSS